MWEIPRNHDVSDHDETFLGNQGSRTKPYLAIGNLGVSHPILPTISKALSHGINTNTIYGEAEFGHSFIFYGWTDTYRSPIWTTSKRLGPNAPLPWRGFFCKPPTRVVVSVWEKVTVMFMVLRRSQINSGKWRSGGDCFNGICLIYIHDILSTA